MEGAADIGLPRGSRVHEYVIEATLGVGGFGLTYLATDSNLDLSVAIKEYLPGDIAMRGADRSVRPRSAEYEDHFRWGLSRFVDESRTLASFRHPNIVRVMRFFQANDTAYMVMEFVAGQPLSTWVEGRRPVAEEAIRAIAHPLLDGLGVVHAAGVLHRDIKPANIFIRDDGSPVLLDFGSARTQGGPELTAIITPGYAPLEQYHAHGRQGPWTDLYAMGGVLYWLVTGSKPVEAAARVGDDPMPPASQAGDRARYSDALLRTVDWMLSPDDRSRPQRVDDVRQILQGGEPVVPASLRIPATPRAAEPHPPSSPLSVPTGVALDPEAMRALESDLASRIGPIARVVLRNAARRSRSVAEVAGIVAHEIEDEAARAVFVARHGQARTSGRIGEPSRPSSPPPVPAEASRPGAPGEAVLAAAEAMLASYLGPLARVVVRRAAARARDETELYLLISDEIDDSAQRKAFIRRAMQRRS